MARRQTVCLLTRRRHGSLLALAKYPDIYVFLAVRLFDFSVVEAKLWLVEIGRSPDVFILGGFCCLVAEKLVFFLIS